MRLIAGLVNEGLAELPPGTRWTAASEANQDWSPFPQENRRRSRTPAPAMVPCHHRPDALPPVGVCEFDRIFAMPGRACGEAQNPGQSLKMGAPHSNRPIRKMPRSEITISVLAAQSRRIRCRGRDGAPRWWIQLLRKCVKDAHPNPRCATEIEIRRKPLAFVAHRKFDRVIGAMCDANPDGSVLTTLTRNILPHSLSTR